MKKVTMILATMVVMTAMSISSARAENIATSTVKVEVLPIVVVSLADNSITLTDECPEMNTSYSLTTNLDEVLLTAKLDENMPDGLILAARAEAPNGGVSLEWKALSVKAEPLVTKISRVAQRGLSIKFRAIPILSGLKYSVGRTLTLTLAEK